MSGYGFGQFIGGVLGIALLSFILKFAFRRFLSGTQLVLATVASAVAVAVFLYAFGAADGGAPRFGAGIAQYGIGGVVAALVWLFLNSRKARKNG